MNTMAPATASIPTPAAFDLAHWSAGRLSAVEAALGRWVSADAPAGLGEAMRYAVLDGGKRLRPLLVLAAAEAVGGHPGAARAVAKRRAARANRGTRGHGGAS